MGHSQGTPSGVPASPWQANVASSSVDGAFPPRPVPAPPQAAGQWDRLVDPTIIRFSTHAKQKVPLSNAVACINEYTRLRGIPAETYKVTCTQGDLGSAFTLFFGGLPHLAATQVTGFFKGIKNPDGTYFEFAAVDPSGDKVLLHPNADKNGKMSKTEGATRRLAKQLKQNYPLVYPITDQKSKLFARRSEGILSHDFVQLAILKVSPEVVVVHWNPKLCLRLGIDKSQETKEFSEAENIQWEV